MDCEKVQAVTAKILCCVDTLPERHISRRLHDSRTESFRMLEMPMSRWIKIADGLVRTLKGFRDFNPNVMGV
jgi:hypothetical protein